jgi:hypothetical protein
MKGRFDESKQKYDVIVTDVAIPEAILQSLNELRDAFSSLHLKNVQGGGSISTVKGAF